MQSTEAISGIVEDQLKTVPWSSLVIRQLPLFIKTKFTDSCYYILVTDLMRVWVRFSEKKSVKQEKQAFNPQFGASIDRILEILKEHLEEQQPSADYSLSFGENDLLSLKLKTKIDFYVFQWEFECAMMEGGPAKHAVYLRDHVIMPVFYVNKLLTRQMKKSVVSSNGRKTTKTTSEVGSLRRSATTVVLDMDNQPPDNDTEELQSPQDVHDDPWFDAFAKRGYQRYISCSLASTTTTHNSGGSGSGGSSLDLLRASTTFAHTETLQLIYTSSFEEEVAEKEQKKSVRYASSTSQHSQSAQSLGSDEDYGSFSQDKQHSNTSNDNDEGDDESPEELRRREIIQERLEREKAKKPKAKKQRFV